MTLLQLWESQHIGDYAAALDLLPPRALPPALEARIATMVARGVGLPAYERGKMENALAARPAAIATAPPPPPPTPPTKPHTTITTAAAPITTPHAKALHKQHAHLHALMVQAALSATPDQSVLADYATQIVGLTTELDTIYNALKKQKADA